MTRLLKMIDRLLEDAKWDRKNAYSAGGKIMKGKDKDSDQGKAADDSQKKSYTQPLLTKHAHLRTLTGKSGEKATSEGPHEDGHDHEDHQDRHVGKDKGKHSH